ncbi:hypothetical protein CAMRE0001_0964 [Campylobacter rectus RM3267]|uniref:Uncharacterized protein n=1 Tax=Campylobacter rectus RM3267 TaxID=553218 RepID=B9D2M7_CAMRE|nr:hypothetical protein CAMRE0001_0964 [Campylobacter rectus RM3267]
MVCFNKNLRKSRKQKQTTSVKLFWIQIRRLNLAYRKISKITIIELKIMQIGPIHTREFINKKLPQTA